MWLNVDELKWVCFCPKRFQKDVGPEKKGVFSSLSEPCVRQFEQD